MCVSATQRNGNDVIKLNEGHLNTQKGIVVYIQESIFYEKKKTKMYVTIYEFGSSRLGVGMNVDIHLDNYSQ